ncbi:MAG: hypothetical protein WHT09_03895 [Thermogutta sp.]|jgi:hypothetical protein
MMEVLLLCMALAYAVVIGAEWLRLRGVRIQPGLAMGLLVAGLLVHTVWLAYRGVMFFEQSQSGGTPLSVRQDWYYGIAWGLAVVCVIWMKLRPKTPFALFLLPPALVLIVVGYFWGDPLPFARHAASRVWGFIHGASLLLAILAVSVAFVAGLMYLGQVRRLKSRPLRTSRWTLPSLEWSQKANTHALGLALAMLAVGIFSGAFLNAIEGNRPQERLPWSDPVVVATSVLFLWLGTSLVVGLVYPPLREGRRVVFLTVVSFLFMLVVLILAVMGMTQHGRPRGTALHATPGGERPVEVRGAAQPNQTSDNDEPPPE